MGFWSYLFPGDEGVLADLFWSNQQTSSGITLKNQTYEGTTGDDTASFAQLSLSYNPYQSEVYLLEGNDSARTVGTDAHNNGVSGAKIRDPARDRHMRILGLSPKDRATRQGRLRWSCHRG